jgi:hypothetical protein
MSHYFLLQGKSSTLKVEIFPPIELNANEQYVLGLDYFACVNSLKNITTQNNEFIYYTGLQKQDFETFERLNETNEIITDEDSYNRLVNYFVLHGPRVQKHSIKLEPGAYEYQGLLKLIWENGNIEKNGFDVQLQENGKFKFLMDGSVAIDFKQSGFNELFGATKKIYWTTSTTAAENEYNIWDISTLQIFCNLIEGAFINGKRTHLLYSFPLIDENGQLIVEKPNHVLYFPINTNVISSIVVEVVDQKHRKVDFGPEELTVALHLKKFQ